MRASPRELTGRWLQLAGAALLLASLFFTWSHQYQPGVLAVPGMSTALAGVPRDPDAWQVYSVMDVLLALLACGLALTSVRGGSGRVALLVLSAVALAFVAHALAAPPTDGVDVIVPGQTRYLSRGATAGPGESLALAALALALVGLGLSSNRVSRRRGQAPGTTR